MSTHVGVTATREGLTRAQKATAKDLLSKVEGTERWLHHGDCKGGDKDLCAIAKDLGFLLESHPPYDHRLRAYVPSDIVNVTKPYAVRNLDIAHAGKYLIAAPKESSFQIRGGTWMTIGMALAAGCIVDVIWPSGSVFRMPPLKKAGHTKEPE